MGETIVEVASLGTVEFPSEVSAFPSFGVGVIGVVVPSLDVIGVEAFLKSSVEMVSKGTHSPVAAANKKIINGLF